MLTKWRLNRPGKGAKFGPGRVVGRSEARIASCLGLRYLRQIQSLILPSWSAIGQHFLASTFREIVAEIPAIFRKDELRELAACRSRQEDPDVADSHGPAKQLICNQQVIGSNPIVGSFATRADSQAIRDPKNASKNRDGRTKVALKIDVPSRGLRGLRFSFKCSRNLAAVPFSCNEC
jgi:hypothetical protein